MSDHHDSLIIMTALLLEAEADSFSVAAPNCGMELSPVEGQWSDCLWAWVPALQLTQQRSVVML